MLPRIHLSAPSFALYLPMCRDGECSNDAAQAIAKLGNSHDICIVKGGFKAWQVGPGLQGHSGDLSVSHRPPDVFPLGPSHIVFSPSPSHRRQAFPRARNCPAGIPPTNWTFPLLPLPPLSLPPLPP